MTRPATGATYGDAIIVLAGFAERHPFRFLLTVPLAAGLVLMILLLAMKLIVVGPLINHKAEYDDKRARKRTEPGPGLPLND